MHRGPRLLLLPNAWDAMSARIVAVGGLPGDRDDQRRGRLGARLSRWRGGAVGRGRRGDARIARTVSVPVTADIETGYGDTPEAVAPLDRRHHRRRRGRGEPRGRAARRPGAAPLDRGHGRAHPRRARGGPRRRRADRDQCPHRSLSSRISATSGAASTRRWRAAVPISRPAPTASTRSHCAMRTRSAGSCAP